MLDASGDCGKSLMMWLTELKSGGLVFSLVHYILFLLLSDQFSDALFKKEKNSNMNCSE